MDEDNPLRRIDIETHEIPISCDLDQYIYICSQGLSAICTAIEKAEMSILMLENARDLLPKDSPYNEYEHIECATENYFIRSRNLYDRCLIFTGQLLNLGIANESIQHVLIVTNQHVIQNKLSPALKKINKACKTFAHERNHIIHQGRYNHESFSMISTIHKANQTCILNGKEPLFKKEHVDFYTDKAIEEKSIDFNAHLEKIKSLIYDYYEVALPVYHLMKKKV